MKIAITGVTGFVGQNLARYLSDIDILGVSREASLETPKISISDKYLARF